jgi:predicted transcriptional regulator
MNMKSIGGRKNEKEKNKATINSIKLVKVLDAYVEDGYTKRNIKMRRRRSSIR